MRVKLGNVEYDVKWVKQHVKLVRMADTTPIEGRFNPGKLVFKGLTAGEAQQLRKGEKLPFKTSIRTYCRISKVTDGEPRFLGISEAFVTHHTKDEPNKRLSHRVSLMKAIHGLPIHWTEAQHQEAKQVLMQAFEQI